jgi:excisionase family DNA binding protein
MHPPQRKPFLNVKEAAQALRLDESTLYRHLREGRIPGVKLGGRYLIPAALIEELAVDAMDAGHCVDVDEWAARRRDEAAEGGRR